MTLNCKTRPNSETSPGRRRRLRLGVDVEQSFATFLNSTDIDTLRDTAPASSPRLSGALAWEPSTHSTAISMGFFTNKVALKVPQVTVYFWLIKVLATTVGETFADFLTADVGLGIGGTSGVMLAITIAALAVQMKRQSYLPPIYWFVIVSISTVGTLLTDNLTDGVGVSLEVTTPIFFVILLLVFAGWYHVEKDLSIHTVDTRRREAWYWLTVLVTFALGTATGDLIAEKLDIGYGNSLLLFAGCIAVTGLFWRFHIVGGVLGFWIVYILTRPLGASLGDLLSQNPADVSDSSASGAGSGGTDAPAVTPTAWKAGLALGTTLTSMIFLGLITLLVIFLVLTKKDQLPPPNVQDERLCEESPRLYVLNNVLILSIGNEITDGFLYPTGKVSNDDFGPFAKLWKAAREGVSDAVAAGTKQPKVMIHLDNGWKYETLEWFFKGLFAEGTVTTDDVDVFGFSFYPFYNVDATLEALTSSLTQMANTYNKPIYVAETDWPTNCTTATLSENYAVSARGQREWVMAIMDVLNGLPSGLGAGIFYWEPGYIAVPGLGSVCGSNLLFNVKWDWPAAYANALSSIYMFGGGSAQTETQAESSEQITFSQLN